MPTSLLLKLNVSYSVISTPEEVLARGESDHAPTALGLGRSARTVIADPPVPRWIVRLDCLKWHLASLCKSVGILSLEVFEQLIVYKSCTKEAAEGCAMNVCSQTLMDQMK